MRLREGGWVGKGVEKGDVLTGILCLSKNDGRSKHGKPPKQTIHKALIQVIILQVCTAPRPRGGLRAEHLAQLLGEVSVDGTVEQSEAAKLLDVAPLGGERAYGVMV